MTDSDVEILPSLRLVKMMRSSMPLSQYRSQGPGDLRNLRNPRYPRGAEVVLGTKGSTRCRDPPVTQAGKDDEVKHGIGLGSSSVGIIVGFVLFTLHFVQRFHLAKKNFKA